MNQVIPNNQYKPPRVNNGELRTWITFFKFKPKDGPEPGEEEQEILFECWAKVDQIWSKDIELAKSNGTLTDVTLTIRDPQDDYYPNNKDKLRVDAREYNGVTFEIKHTQPDMQNKDFIKVIAEVTS